MVQQHAHTCMAYARAISMKLNTLWDVIHLACNVKATHAPMQLIWLLTGSMANSIGLILS